MKHKRLPGILHLKEQNPYIELEGTPFYIVKKPEEWDQLKNEEGMPIPRRSGVSAFGFGGANAHVVIEEYVPGHQPAESPDGGEYVISLSAKTPERLFEYAKALYDHLEVETDLSTGDIAFTLHTGREVYEHRLALICTTIVDVKESLKAFITGKTKGKKVFTGHKDKTGAQLAFITSGKSGEVLLASILKHNEIDKLAQLWVAGFDFDWLVLYTGALLKQISLPGYPFAHDSYWIQDAEEKGLVAMQKVRKLHLLVDANESTLHEEKFTTLLKGDEFYLTDHLIGRSKVLPGVAYIEMARAAGELAGERRVERIQNIMWLKPIVVNGCPREINISFYPNESSVDFEVSSQDDENQRILHSQGRIIYEGSNMKLLSPGDVDIKSVVSRCSEERSMSECYELFEHAGFKYGQGFKSLKKLYFNDKEGVSFIELPSILANTSDEFYLHPSIMDASLQTVLGMINNGEEEKIVPFLPFSLDELVIFSRLPMKCIAYVKSKKELASNVKIYDIAIIDETGKVLVAMKNFTLKSLADGNGNGVKEEGKETLSDEQILALLNKLKKGSVSTEDADKIICGYYK